MLSNIALLSLVSAALAVPFNHPLYPRGNETVSVPTGTGVNVPTTVQTTVQQTETTTVLHFLTMTRAGAQQSGAPEAGAAAASNVGVEQAQVSQAGAAAQSGAANGVCGGVVTSTIKQQITVTVTAGSETAPTAAAPVQEAPAPEQNQVAPAPVESAAPVETPSSVPAPAPAPVEIPSSAAPVEAAPSSTEDAGYTAPTPTQESTPPTTGSGKRGLAYNDASLTTAFKNEGKISWAFNWEATPKGLDTSFEYVPMLWGLKSDFTSTWDNFVSEAKSAGSKYFMAFNEPDHDGQANMSPAAAADAYRQYMNPVKEDGIYLGSPSVTNGGGAMGLTWLSSFMDACSDCSIDFCNVHWYDSASNTEYFKNHMQQAHEACNGKPIWVTEYGTNGGSDAEIKTFLETVNPWMDEQDYIHRYAYFMVKEGSLVSGTAESAIGSVYASV